MIGDSRYLSLKDKSVNCIITSPPYWSLRKYDIPDLIWDGEEGCEHEWGKIIRERVDETGFERNRRGLNKAAEICDGNPRVATTDIPVIKKESQFCLHCSAWRGQLGLESTIDLYLKHLMQIMDECWRVLRDDGTMWVNLGDSYGSGTGAGGSLLGRDKRDENKIWGNKPIKGMEKSLCLIPERFVIEMVNRGWILRNKIIWHKPNCMPSSVKDRFTVDFEPVFFFVKSRKYWFETQYEEGIGITSGVSEITKQKAISHFSQKPSYNEFRQWYNKNIKHKGKFDNEKNRKGLGEGNSLPIYYKIFDDKKDRNRRCVWTIPTQPYPESHFATFPEALIEPMIRAGCPKEICVKCGKAREKIVELEYKGGCIDVNRDHYKQPNDGYKVKSEKGFSGTKSNRAKIIKNLTGLTDCGCSAGSRPGIVLDPFCGSGTTMRVAEKLNRIGIGIDLGYGNLQGKRLTQIQKELL